MITLINGALYYFGSGWINMLTDGDQNALKEVIELAPLLIIFISLQSSITLMIAVLRGAGKLSTGSVATCILMASGIFLSNLLGHKEHYREVQNVLEWVRLDKLAGIHGQLTGYCISLAALNLFLAMFISKLDWNLMSQVVFEHFALLNKSALEKQKKLMA